MPPPTCGLGHLQVRRSIPASSPTFPLTIYQVHTRSRLLSIWTAMENSMALLLPVPLMNYGSSLPNDRSYRQSLFFGTVSQPNLSRKWELRRVQKMCMDMLKAWCGSVIYPIYWKHSFGTSAAVVPLYGLFDHLNRYLFELGTHCFLPHHWTIIMSTVRNVKLLCFLFLVQAMTADIAKVRLVGPELLNMHLSFQWGFRVSFGFQCFDLAVDIDTTEVFWKSVPDTTKRTKVGPWKNYRDIIENFLIQFGSKSKTKFGMGSRRAKLLHFRVFTAKEKHKTDKAIVGSIVIWKWRWNFKGSCNLAKYYLLMWLNVALASAVNRT